MCGISVIVSLHGHKHRPELVVNGDVPNGVKGIDVNADAEAAGLAKELHESLDVISHRGPDSRGLWISDDKRIALGHCRLAIQDLSPDGYQPIHDAENTVHAVVNGEFYDHDRIREELIRECGYKFKGRSDSEIAIALYKRYGLSFLRHLRGEYALCLYDSKTQNFIAARDRYGVKPLFWTIVQGRLLIAAEIKAFLPLGWKPKWDVKSLLDGGWNFDQRTVFEGVHKVRPGHYITCASFGHIEQRLYWDIDFPDKHLVDSRTEKDMIEGVRARLLEAVRLRLRADVPVGIYLSGGIDSSAIAGLVTHLVKEEGIAMGNKDATDRVTCFSVAFDEDSGYDESAIANRTAEWLKVKYIKKLMNEQSLADSFEDATWHCEQQNNDLNYIGKYKLSEVVRESDYKVVLTGEGADEIFGGYTAYLPDYLREPDLAMPQAALGEVERSKQYEKAQKQLYEDYDVDAATRKPSVATRELNGISTATTMATMRFPMFAKWTLEAYGYSDPRITIADSADGTVRDKIMQKWHPLHAAEYIWGRGNLVNLFLSCLGDRTEMAHSVEARTPFLDHVLAEYANNLPPSVKIRYAPAEDSFVEKWILREAVKPFITKELYERRKHAYGAPRKWPVGGPLHKLMQRLVTQENVLKLGFVDIEKTCGLVERAFVEGDNESYRLMLVVAQWIVISERFGVQTAEPF